MSKQVIVSTKHGKDYVYDADRTFTEDGDLFVAKGDAGIAVHRDWLHAEIREKPKDPPPEPETVKIQKFGSVEITFAEAEQGRNETPCTNCGYVPVLVFKNYGETFCFECYKKQNPKETVQW